MSRSRWRGLIKWIGILIGLYYFYRFCFNKDVKDKKSGFLPEDIEDVKSVKLSKTVHVLTNACSTVTKLCYGVKDFTTDDSGLRVHRAMYVNGFESEFDTIVRLSSPQNGLSFFESDTRLWSVDHSRLSAQFVTAMSVFPFALGSVHMNDKEAVKVMSIGLGGGSIDMFLHELRPEWKIDVYELDPVVSKISLDWFGVVNDANHRVYTQDALLAIEEAVKQDLKYDVIMADGCDANQTVPCPAKEFLEDKHLANMRRILKPTGCLIMNVLVMEDSLVDHYINSINDRLLRHFPTCLVVRVEVEENAVLACLPNELDPLNAEVIKEEWKRKLDTLVDEYYSSPGLF